MKRNNINKWLVILLTLAVATFMVLPSMLFAMGGDGPSQSECVTAGCGDADYAFKIDGWGDDPPVDPTGTHNTGHGDCTITISDVKTNDDGEYAMFGNLLVQYGGGYMAKGGFDRYTPFKLNPDADFFIIGWPMGLMQASKNPFKKGKNKYHLGDIAKSVLDKNKTQLSKIILTFGEVKRKMESSIWKKGSWDSFGFTMNDLESLFGEHFKISPWAKKNKDMVRSIANTQFTKLLPKQKKILDNIEINLYDLIKFQSGGHKDITNISGFSFIPGKGEGVEWLKTFMVEVANLMKDMKLE